MNADQERVIDDEAQLYGMELKNAMALSEDEPKLREALNGEELED